MVLEIDGTTINFTRLQNTPIPYVGYYDRYEEQVIGVDSYNKVYYTAKAKISHSENIVDIYCIELV